MRLPAVLLIAVLLSGCTGSSEQRPEAAGSPSTAAATPLSSPTAAASASASPSPSTAAQPVIEVLPEGFEGGFRTPSGNISCYLSRFAAVCGLRDRTWPDPPERNVCDAGVGSSASLRLARQATAEMTCGTFDEEGEPRPVLAYGHALQVDGRRCVSSTEGVDCVVVGTSRGFFVSRESYRLTASRTPLTMAPSPPAPRGPTMVVNEGFVGGIRTPSRNILCNISRSLVFCYAHEHPWTRPPVECRGGGAGDPESTIEVGATGRARVVGTCWSDFPMREGIELAYGQTLALGPMSCTSARTGLTCTNRTTKHGFEVSRSSYRLF